MKKILVTGGAGYIGSHTALELVVSGYEPVIIDNFSNSSRRIIQVLERLADRKLHCIEADAGNVDVLREVCLEHSISGIIHFAAYKAVGESVEQPLRYYENNLFSTMAAIKVMREANIHSMVFSSSCTVYGQPDENPVSEATPWKEASSPYGYTKQICERMLSNVSKNDKHSGYCLLRYFNPVGAHPSGEIGELPRGVPSNLVPFITQTAAGLRDELTVFGGDYQTADGTCIRDFIHVVDLARAHVAALNWCEKNPGSCKAFNLGQGKGNSVLEAIRSFENVTGVLVNFKIGQRRSGDIEQVWANVEAAEKELGWKTTFNIDDAMRDAWKWQVHLRENPGLFDGDN
jgi:UDP-glucose 4-epimerase